MKRILLISMLLVIAISISFSQIAYKKGDKVGSLMLGLGSFVYEPDATSTVPPLSVAADWGYNENISVGGILSYTASKYEWNNVWGNYGYKYTWSYIIVAARGAYHLDVLHDSKIDTYGGVSLGFKIASTSETYTGDWGLIPHTTAASGGGILFGLFAGGRYYFSPNLAAQAEVGFGIALLNIGIAYKL